MAVPALPLITTLATVAILALDFALPAGASVGTLLCLPVLLSATGRESRHVWSAALLALAAMLLTAARDLAAGDAPGYVIPRQIIVVVAVGASMVVALALQARRREAELVRDRALSAGNLNRVLVSLLAHDLRAPLTLAAQGLDYVRDALAEGRPIAVDLVTDMRARLGRSLQNLEAVLGLARVELTRSQAPITEAAGGVHLKRELEGEVLSFAPEARANGMVLVAELSELDDGQYRVDPLVIRQAIAILIDNAIRHALPGTIYVSARLAGTSLVVSVQDEGPGLRANAGRPAEGAGVGLQLCRALMELSGGRVEIAQDAPTGSTLVLHLPVFPVTAGARAAAEHVPRLHLGVTGPARYDS